MPSLPQGPPVLTTQGQVRQIPSNFAIEFVHKVGVIFLDSMHLRSTSRNIRPHHFMGNFTNGTETGHPGGDPNSDDYDKFMSELWTGAVIIMIVLTVLFCGFMCFLYHQFCAWRAKCKSKCSLRIVYSTHTLHTFQGYWCPVVVEIIEVFDSILQ